MSTDVIPHKNWLAKLDICVAGREDKTVISHREHIGPLVVQKPFYPEGDVCHIYILHPPGGIVGGDEVRLNIETENAANVLFTTPGATKFYRSHECMAHVAQTINLKDHSIVEWLPQENIFFDGSHTTSKTKIYLDKGSTFIGWDIACFGRPASNDFYEKGVCRQSFEIWRDGKPLFLDRANISGGDDIFDACWGLQSYRTSGTFILTSITTEFLNLARETLALVEQDEKKGLISFTLIDDVLVCRGLSQQAEWMKQKFITVWQTLRPKISQKEACPPRIWST